MRDEVFSLVNLKYFCDAVRLGGLSHAAKANFVTQSAISQGILKLEKTLGVSLLAHHPNRLRLTAQGETIYNESLDLLNQITHFQKKMPQEEALGNLEFACTHSFALAVIPPYLKRFKEEYPDVKVHFSLGSSEEILQLVREGMVDFGILPLEICQKDQCQPYGADLARFNKRTIYSGSFEFYSMSQRADQGFIVTPEGKETLYLREKLGQELKSIMEVGAWDIIAELVSQGLGIGYLPDYLAKKLQVYPLDLEKQLYRISAISPKGMKLRKSSEIFLSYFINS